VNWVAIVVLVLLFLAIGGLVVAIYLQHTDDLDEEDR
jgi:hypothetical protein